jgi:predicted acetyltransferase
LWQRLLDPYDGRGSITYLIGNEDAPDGFAIFRPGTRDAGVPQALQSTDVAANTPAALQRLLTLIRDHRSMCDTFEWYGAPNDPLHFLADEQFLQIKHFMRWMLRIVSVEKALEQRGYPKDVQAQLHFEIEDPILNENTGRWLLNINQGTASVEPGGEGHLRINIQALAPLFSSFYSAEELVTCGAIESSNNDQIQLATRVFSGPAPWLPEIF